MTGAPLSVCNELSLPQSVLLQFNVQSTPALVESFLTSATIVVVWFKGSGFAGSVEKPIVMLGGGGGC